MGGDITNQRFKIQTTEKKINVQSIENLKYQRRNESMKKSIKTFLCLFLFLAIFSSPVVAEEKSNYELTKAIEMMKNSIGFSGAIELDYGYVDDGDIGDNTVNDSTSDLDIGTVELGAEIAFHEYATGHIAFKAEGLDADDHVFCDEAVIDIRKQGFAPYLTLGKRGLPFGAFESHLITDPLTQDLYEIADTGMTVGFTPGVSGLDVSLTVYKGEVLMTHMLEGAYKLDRTYLDDTGALPAWRTGGMHASYNETDDVSSFIGHITLEPMEGMALGAFYNSEPGDSQRNDTLGGMFHFEISRLTLDTEYITAVQRETNSADNLEHKESALSGAMAFQCTDKLEAALRYEVFNDDIPGNQDGNLEDRYSLGLNYALLEKENFAIGLSFEYRQSSYEKASGSTADDSLNELFAKLGIEF
jgi:hypothetical protein